MKKEILRLIKAAFRDGNPTVEIQCTYYTVTNAQKTCTIVYHVDFRNDSWGYTIERIECGGLKKECECFVEDSIFSPLSRFLNRNEKLYKKEQEENKRNKFRNEIDEMISKL